MAPNLETIDTEIMHSGGPHTNNHTKKIKNKTKKREKKITDGVNEDGPGILPPKLSKIPLSIL